MIEIKFLLGLVVENETMFTQNARARVSPSLKRLALREVNMDNVEEKKEWVAPELKKVSVEELTAHLHLLRPMNDDNPLS